MPDKKVLSKWVIIVLFWLISIIIISQILYGISVVIYVIAKLIRSDPVLFLLILVLSKRLYLAGQGINGVIISMAEDATGTDPVKETVKGEEK